MLSAVPRAGFFTANCAATRSSPFWQFSLSSPASRTSPTGSAVAARTAVAAVVGLLSGIFGGLVGNQGGLRAAGLSAFNLTPKAFLATGTAVALLIDVARTPFYLVNGGEQLLVLWVPIAVATAGCVAGTIAGERVFLRMPPHVYRRVIGSAVLALGIWFLVA